MKFFFQHVFRYALRHKALAVINILSVAVGVSVYLAIQIVNDSATRAFEAGIDLVSGRANLEARGTFDDLLLPELSKVPGVTAATPLVEGLVTLPGYPGEYLHVVGVEPLTNREFNSLQIGNLSGHDFNLDQWFADSRAIAVSRRFADDHHLIVGSLLNARVGEREFKLQVGSILNVGEGDSRYAAMDIGWAQELLGLQGKLTGVLFRIESPMAPAATIDQLSKHVPPDVLIQEPSQRSAQVAKMLAGFQLNLTALSLIALLVGVFLIYNTITASVVRRRNEVGILRSIGASQARVRWLFLGEAMLYGSIGTVMGCCGGILLANFLVRAVSKTVTNLYLLVSIDHFYLPVWQFPLVLITGMGSVLLGAWIPANAGARLPPLQALNLGQLIEKGRRPEILWIFLSLLFLLLASVSGLVALEMYRWAGFASAFFTLAGFCLLSPHVTYGCGSLVRIMARHYLFLQLAGRNLVRSLYRHAITVAALAAALAMSVGVSIMIFSFRNTVDRWINRRLVADLFVSPASNEIVGMQNFVAPELLAFLGKQPEVELIDTYRNITVSVNDQPVSLGVSLGTHRNVPEFVGGRDQEKYRRFQQSGEVMISEPLSRRLKVYAGSNVTIRTPSGIQTFRIAGVFYDYTKDAGIMVMQRSNFDKYWHDARINSVALYLRNGSEIDNVIRVIRQNYPKAADYSIRSNKSLHKIVVDIFDQTFAVTYLLRVIALFVAVIGIVLNLTVLVKEREREFGTMRAIGVSIQQLRDLIVLESLLIALSALAIGVLAGMALSVVLTYVINQAFFGWTIPLEIPWEQLVSIPLWLFPVAVIAALIPANGASKTRIIDLIRR